VATRVGEQHIYHTVDDGVQAFLSTQAVVLGMQPIKQAPAN